LGADIDDAYVAPAERAVKAQESSGIAPGHGVVIRLGILSCAQQKIGVGDEILTAARQL
jgi:hypothetical protein